jgi:hypothetical protein
MSIPTDADLVNIAAQIYDGAAGFDHYDDGEGDRICWGLKHLESVDIVAFRGSITAHDWWDDVRADPILTNIGTVHHGFHVGMGKLWDELRPMLSKPVVLTGHSLGAARADILAGLMLADGETPIRRSVFGEPLPGMADFAAFIGHIPASSYRNTSAKHFLHDLVTDVPLRLLPPFDFVRPTPLTDICVEPTGDIFETHGLFAFHHISLYQQGVTAKFAKDTQ